MGRKEMPLYMVFVSEDLNKRKTTSKPRNLKCSIKRFYSFQDVFCKLDDIMKIKSYFHPCPIILSKQLKCSKTQS